MLSRKNLSRSINIKPQRGVGGWASVIALILFLPDKPLGRFYFMTNKEKIQAMSANYDAKSVDFFKDINYVPIVGDVFMINHEANTVERWFVSDMVAKPFEVFRMEENENPSDELVEIYTKMSSSYTPIKSDIHIAISRGEVKMDKPIEDYKFYTDENEAYIALGKKMRRFSQYIHHESYLHKQAKELLFSWLTGMEKEDKKAYPKNLELPFGWRSPNYGVHMELPFYESSDPYYFECSGGIQYNATKGRIFDPYFDRGAILFVPDICIFHKGTAAVFVEVVHKSKVTPDKIRAIKKLYDGYYLEVWEIDAQNILSQTNLRCDLKFRKILEL